MKINRYLVFTCNYFTNLEVQPVFHSLLWNTTVKFSSSSDPKVMVSPPGLKLTAERKTMALISELCRAEDKFFY